VATVDVKKLFEGEYIFLGGIGPSIETKSFSENEIDLLEKFIDEYKGHIKMVSPTLAYTVEKHKDLIHTMGEIFKSKVDKSFGGEIPSPGSFGIKALFPFDIHYTDTPSATEPAYTAYGKYTWEVDTTAGTPVYLLGDASHFFKMKPTTGSRAIALIFQNGIIEVGSTPKFYQFKIDSERNTYPPFNTSPLADVRTDPERAVYIHKTPFAIPLWYDFGVKLQAVPHYTGTADIRLLGIVFYEYDYYSAPVTG
jgi:hypothetical protein